MRPAEQVLHALEALLAAEIRSFEPVLTIELARHLNAAWCARTRRHHELLFNLAAPWADNWTQEAQRRTTDDAMATSALSLLLQEALATPPEGDRAVDLLAVADMVALAQLILHSGITAVAGVADLLEVGSPWVLTRLLLSFRERCSIEVRRGRFRVWRSWSC
ncbi:hypothetical protein ABZ153_41610 [Streptomyces sp. NPDC006290]|uniref:hypothetical protein n=1 Tax=Streptomyces sp. NPDC006290 TaxID=3156745 RepID=UPI0033BDBE8A